MSEKTAQTFLDRLRSFKPPVAATKPDPGFLKAYTGREQSYLTRLDMPGTGETSVDPVAWSDYLARLPARHPGTVHTAPVEGTGGGGVVDLTSARSMLGAVTPERVRQRQNPQDVSILNMLEKYPNATRALAIPATGVPVSTAVHENTHLADPAARYRSNRLAGQAVKTRAPDFNETVNHYSDLELPAMVAGGGVRLADPSYVPPAGYGTRVFDGHADLHGPAYGTPRQRAWAEQQAWGYQPAADARTQQRARQILSAPRHGSQQFFPHALDASETWVQDLRNPDTPLGRGYGAMMRSKNLEAYRPQPSLTPPVTTPAPASVTSMTKGASATFSEGEIIDYFLQHHKKPGNPGRSHADLRLGRPGEPLQSWAIPKERLPEVGERLLAPETEPHAYGYGRFSGKFGKGRNASEVGLLEAGHGTVGGVKDGVFTFSIKNGDKTRKFALVRIKGRKKWLVIGQNPEKTPVVAADSEKTAAGMVKTVEVPMKLVSSTEDPKADVCVEVADTPEKRSEGLSKRAELPEGRGMFFDTPGPFWMKDVNMPLDVIFMSKSGSVLDFCTMEAEDPYIETSKPVDKSASTCKQKPLKLYKSASPEAAYAIEVPAGWSKRHNVQPGDRFETA